MSACQFCHQRHHTLLHNTASATSVTAPAHNADNVQHVGANYAAEDVAQVENATALSAIGSSTDTAAARSSSCLKSSPNLVPTNLRTVLLATALVKVRDCSGRFQSARLLLDYGSHASFVTESCVQRLGLPRTSSTVVITGIGSSQGGRSRGETLLSLSSYSSDQCYAINALILPKITSDLPTQALATHTWPHIQGLVLADPNFMKPGPIDILVGVDVMDRLICSEIRKGPQGTPITQRTVFGWTLFGSVDGASSSNPRLQSLHCDVQLDRALTRLWELEEAPQKRHLTYEERFCEEHFESTHQRSPDGRFIVELPLKADVTLGESR
ncbi:PREDICTED: uncharacterized protein LOC108360192 [Rhagoletis zephyria]|uniref:uncharacterized protein LOC108360192 n=1 Tax=Rhagoletis zephyria TaxID=28612 RepID=UPI0008112842|nr:PREDICTED: uncharacterized protein LOC108360192 [Rhagoletis zephyria]